MKNYFKFIFFAILLLSQNLISQTCTTPITVATNGSWTSLDSFNVESRYFKFRADGENYRIKILVSNLDTIEHSLDITENACSSPFNFSPLLRMSGDTIITYQSDLIAGNDYLIVLNNGLQPAYMKYKVSISGPTAFSVTLQSCNSGDCSYNDLCGELVCNGGFECISPVPFGISGIYSPYSLLPTYGHCNNWGSATDGTPDLFSSTNPNGFFSVPCNFNGQQGGHNNSNSYAGILQYEVLQTKLSAPLTINKAYIISFYVSKADRMQRLNNSLSLFLSGTQMYAPTWSVPVTFAPVATITNTTLLNNYSSWERISVCFTPTQTGMQYLAIGSTQTISSITYTTTNPFCFGINPTIDYNNTYLYIDDVSVKAVEDIIDNNQILTVCSNTATSINALSCPPGSDPYSVTWLPATGLSSSLSPSPTVTLTSSQVYTIVMNYTSAVGGTCSASGTSTINVKTSCCTTTATPVPGGVLPIGTSHYAASRYFVSNVIVPPGGQLILDDDEFLISSNVKITVSQNATLTIIDSHLYSCDNDVWTGIVAKDGAFIEAYKSVSGRNDNMIEDATIAIDATRNSPGSNILTRLDLTHVTFNKNHTGIKITDYTQNSSNYPFTIRNCVFTCRNFQASITPTGWPSTSNLRSATSPTTDLISPYSLGNATVTTVKNTNTLVATVSSTLGIHLVNVGYTSNAGLNTIYKGITVGDGTDYTKFNLFDNIGTGIYATNTNLYSYNNAFQNSKPGAVKYFKSGGSTPSSSGIYIESNPSSGSIPLFNPLLNLNPSGNTNPSLGNRFWNCYHAVLAVNLFSLNACYGTYRSSHAYTLSTLYTPGAYGLLISTNRFAGYKVENNNFNNLVHSIAIDAKPGTYYATTNTLTGIYSGNISVKANYFGSAINNTTTLSGNWALSGLSMNCLSSGVTWNTPAGAAVNVYNNEMDRLLKGVEMKGFKPKTTNIYSNNIKLMDNWAMYNSLLAQSGINVQMTSSVSVFNNTLSATTNTNVFMNVVHAGFNNALYMNCNYLTGGYRGFVFESANPGTRWKGNTMQSQQRGMTLYGAGAIGAQGTPGNPSDNQWLGSWSTPNYCTYVDVGSNAFNSILTTRTGTWIPANNSGDPSVSPLVWYDALWGTLLTTTSGAYSCGSSTIATPVFTPNPGDYESDDMFYIAQMSLYNYLREYPELMEGNSDLEAFYEGVEGTSFEAFANIEEEFYLGNSSTAQSLNSAITATNTVETNSKLYYSLYGAFIDEAFDSSDSTELYDLAHLCAFTNGACVNKARILYDMIYYNLEDYSNMCGSDGLRMANVNSTGLKNGNWAVFIYPNPSSSHLIIQSTGKASIQHLEVFDVSGRMVFDKELENPTNMSKLDLSVPNGIYFMKIRSSENEVLTKKILIQR